MILHTINNSSALDKCLGLIARDDVVVLLEDGVYIAMKSDRISANVYVIEADAKARGINQRLEPAATQIDYNQFVELSTQADKICSWF
jgi:sulfur relay protein TusB/DsrH